MRRLALVCHVVLLGAVAALAWSAASAPVARAITLVVGITPLLVTSRGAASGAVRSAQWLAVLLVAYAGVGAVEVVASSGGSLAGILVLLAALVELGLLLAIIRRAPREARG